MQHGENANVMSAVKVVSPKFLVMLSISEMSLWILYLFSSFLEISNVIFLVKGDRGLLAIANMKCLRVK